MTVRSVKKMILGLGIGIGLVCGATTLAWAQGTTSFKIYIPRKVALNHLPTSMELINIGTVKSIVSVTSGNPVVFTITDPNGVSKSFPALTPGGMQQTLNFASGDTVTVTPNTDPNDPNRYEIDFILRSNSAIDCTGTQSQAQSVYAVAVQVMDPQITGVCLDSYDGRYRSIPLNTCTNMGLGAQPIPIPPSDPADKAASLDPNLQPTTGCFLQRPPVDVLMVLDKSGSMQTTTPFNGMPIPRIQALHTAVSNFVKVWSGIAVTGDKIGAVFFDTTSPTQPAIANFPLSLTDMTLGATQTNVPNWVNVVGPGGATSIGAGLHQADNLFVNDGNRKVFLLMSDGQQNTEPLVKGDRGLYCNNPAVCTAQNPPIPQTCTAVNACPLSTQAQIYTVTLGPSGSVDPAIAQAIATGFYLNTETNYPLLSPFFLELLQNFVRFNSYETVRIISVPTPYTATIPISTTSHNVVFSVMWPSQARLRLTVTPPGGAEPIVRDSASGLISLVQPLPLAAHFDPRGDWKITIEEITGDLAAAAATTKQGGVPFDLHVMTDDGGIKTDLSVVPGDYKPGDKIKLRAKLTRFGLPILGLRSHAVNTVEAKLIRPGESIGDILSNSDASADSSCPSPGTCDQQSPAEAKLANTLQNDPSVLAHDSATVQLYDDGKPEHGDDVAGDGIYSALYTATLPGHYNFTIAVESVAPDAVRFSRQQLRTVYVRPYPDPGNFDFQSSVSSAAGRTKTLSIVMTPRTKAGDLMGPSWANYFWFTPAGQPPFKAKDNLDGTYTANLTFTGSKPKVSVGFVDALAMIDDSVSYNALPAKPTTLFDDIPEPKKFAAFLDAGAGIPHGTFGNGFNTGFSLNAGLEYMFNSHFSAEGIFGYHHFPAKIGSSLNVYQFSGNAKIYLKPPPNKVRPFVNFGPGAYKFSPGSGNFGGNFGGGVLYELSSHVGLQGSYNFHVVNTTGAATKFSTLQGGLRFVF